MLAGRGARDKIKAEVTERLRQQDWPQWASPTFMVSQGAHLCCSVGLGEAHAIWCQTC